MKNKSNGHSRSRRKPCVVTGSVSGPCDRCRQRMEPAHLPLAAHGMFCAACCPVCAAQKSTSASVSAGEALRIACLRDRYGKPRFTRNGKLGGVRATKAGLRAIRPDLGPYDVRVRDCGRVG